MLIIGQLLKYNSKKRERVILIYIEKLLKYISNKLSCLSFNFFYYIKKTTERNISGLTLKVQAYEINLMVAACGFYHLLKPPCYPTLQLLVEESWSTFGIGYLLIEESFSRFLMEGKHLFLGCEPQNIAD